MFAIQNRPLDVTSLTELVKDVTAGGFVSFEGWVRNHNEGQPVDKLEYEVYHALAIKEGEKVLAEALDKFDIVKALCVHREGMLEVRDLAVWVGVSAVHRGDAFKACEYIIGQVKVRLPIWKKEYYAGGDTGWVNCEHCAVHGHLDVATNQRLGD